MVYYSEAEFLSAQLTRSQAVKILLRVKILEGCSALTESETVQLFKWV